MLIYQPYPLKTRKQNNRVEVFDIVRKMWVNLSPEELVRQHFIHYLINEKKYPTETIAVEKEFFVFNVKKRFDVAVLNKKQEFALVAECKAPNVQLNDDVLQQLLTYNLHLNAFHLVITNGLQQVVFEKTNNLWTQTNDIKSFQDINR